MTDRDADDLVPVSVRLGEVVQPEDPEDWTRPLTWVAALGMLAGPVVVFGWFVLARPSSASAAEPWTLVAAVALAIGAALTGATQQGWARASTATLGAGLFGALLVVVLGVVMAGTRQTGVASPTLAHAFWAAVGGLAGTAIAAVAAGVVASWGPRLGRLLIAAAAGAIVAWLVLGWPALV